MFLVILREVVFFSDEFEFSSLDELLSPLDARTEHFRYPVSAIFIYENYC